MDEQLEHALEGNGIEAAVHEEAAVQGLVAGINAALKLQGKDPLILTRDTSYIGTLIDDLVTKENFEQEGEIQNGEV